MGGPFHMAFFRQCKLVQNLMSLLPIFLRPAMAMAAGYVFFSLVSTSVIVRNNSPHSGHKTISRVYIDHLSDKTRVQIMSSRDQRFTISFTMKVYDLIHFLWRLHIYTG